MYMNFKSIRERERDQQKQEQLIDLLSKRFVTYGYTKMKTPAFEEYDLYSKVNSSINLKQMIKMIDHTGNVLVLRPDMTIPMTRQIAQEFNELLHDIKYFYIEDVFRQSESRHIPLGRTQAGVEYYGNDSVEADAEVVSLAIHILKDVGFKNIRIEMGDAGFFKVLTQNMNLNQLQFNELKQLIQAKNAVDLDRFLQKIPIDEDVKQIIKHMPFLYGRPETVRLKLNTLPLSVDMSEKIDYLFQIVELLDIYDLKDHIILDLGLINQMDYYSDVIFQGFVEKVGEPVMMGGRYNQLGESFKATLPAIGFACFIDTLVSAAPIEQTDTSIDVLITYDRDQLEQSIRIANTLRQHHYRVMTSEENTQSTHKTYTFTVSLTSEENVFVAQNERRTFENTFELLDLIESRREGM